MDERNVDVNAIDLKTVSLMRVIYSRVPDWVELILCSESGSTQEVDGFIMDMQRARQLYGALGKLLTAHDNLSLYTNDPAPFRNVAIDEDITG
jgi:hypothetical protein